MWFHSQNIFWIRFWNKHEVHYLYTFYNEAPGSMALNIIINLMNEINLEKRNKFAECTNRDSDISAIKIGTKVNPPPLLNPDSTRDKYKCHGYVPYSIRIQLIWTKVLIQIFVNWLAHKLQFEVKFNRNFLLTACGIAKNHSGIFRPAISAIM